MLTLKLKNTRFTHILCFFSALTLLFLVISCAQKVPPTGGKKDIVAPKILYSLPKNQTLNFNSNTIEIYFDEYVKVENINQNLLITPAIEGNYSSKIKPTGVKLTFDKPFKTNTTYNFNFRNTFKDITENNEAKNVRLVFSTGNQIDSMKVKGKVTDPLTNKPVFDALVGLYKIHDSLNIKKEKPYYFTKTDSSGIFNIENIQNEKYKILAFSDNNNNTIFNEATEKIAYRTDTLNVNKNLDNINLSLVKQDKVPLKINKTRTTVNYAFVELNKGVQDIKINFKTPSDSLPFLITTINEIKFFNTKSIMDTVKYELKAIDSVGVVSIISGKFIFKKAAKKTDTIKDEFKLLVTPNQNNPIENNTIFTLKFSKPILNFDLSKLQFKEDTLNLIQLNEGDIKWNNTKNELTLSPKSKSKKVLRLNIIQPAFISIENDSLKNTKIDFKIIDPEDTGTISGEIKNSKSNEIVQLLTEKYEIVSEIKYKSKYTFTNILPGKYYLRIVSDINKNGKWDAGNIDKNEYPENIQFINTIIQLKSNFELSGYDFTIQ